MVSAVVGMGRQGPLLHYQVRFPDGTPMTDLQRDEVTIARVQLSSNPSWVALPTRTNAPTQLHPGFYLDDPRPQPPATDWRDPLLSGAILAVEVIRGTDQGAAYACRCDFDPNDLPAGDPG